MPNHFRSACLALLLFAAPAAAHHTFVAKYDAKTVRASGTITSVSFGNPHVEFTLQSGKGSWTIETESISALAAKGIPRAALKEGAMASVTGWPARDGSARMGLKSISISGGPSATVRGSAR